MLIFSNNNDTDEENVINYIFLGLPKGHLALLQPHQNQFLSKKKNITGMRRRIRKKKISGIKRKKKRRKKTKGIIKIKINIRTGIRKRNIKNIKIKTLNLSRKFLVLKVKMLVLLLFLRRFRR